jgi:hypothetical protein
MLKRLKTILLGINVQDQRDYIVTIAFDLEERLQVSKPITINVDHYQLKLAYVQTVMGV